MYFKNFVLSLFSLFIIYHPAKGQSSVAVDPLTGTASLTIPVYNLTMGSTSMPVYLSYRATGIKPKDVEGSAGIGWQLQTGGRIVRMVKGLPDDVKKDLSGVSRTGWMYNGQSVSNISGFNIANSGTGNCTNEASDISYISSHFSFSQDTEPDIFYVSAPGLSCQLVYDNVSQKFKTISYQDLLISCTYDTGTSYTNGAITSFSITNDAGLTYVFSVTERTRMQTVPNGTLGTYFNNTYQQYQNAVDYNSTWYLKTITDPNGAGIQLNYAAASSRSSSDPIVLYAGASGGSATAINQYSIKKTVWPQVLANLKTFDNDVVNDALTFNWIANPRTAYGTDQTMISSISGLGKNLNFGYKMVRYQRTDLSYYYRSFLSNYYDGGNASPINYKFSYVGETYDGNYNTTLSDSTSSKIDYWGYFNPALTTLNPALLVNPGSPNYKRYTIRASTDNRPDYTYLLSGTMRNADPVHVADGSLQTITYAQGGTTTLNYESNDYYDPQAIATISGGGIRIKSIVDNNGFGNVMTRNYSYIDPANSKSSGKPLSLPVYAFTVPYNGNATGSDYWNYSTVRSQTDLSEEDHTILYRFVKLSQAGAGSTVYQYYIPATNWDMTASPACSGCAADWAAVSNLSARPTCVSYGAIKNDFDSYPFLPYLNYDFERGLLQKVSSFNDTGIQVSETNYTYQRSSAPGIITAFKYDLNNNGAGLSATAYGKYAIYYGTSELTTTVSKKLFDSQGNGQSQVSTTTNTYGNTYHKLASQQTVNSDQSILTTNYSYTKDYSVTTGANANINAIYNLQQLNINAPVETYATIKRGTAPALVTAASLTLYSGFTGVNGQFYLPSQQLKLIQPDGGAGFSPMSISGATINKDARYYVAANITAYDDSGSPLTIDDNNKHIQASVINHYSNQPEITIKNAAAKEVGFADFDSYLNGIGTYSSGGTFSGTAPSGSHNGNSKGMSNGQSLSFTVSKTQSANYIFSAWVNSSAAATFNFSIVPVSGTTVTASRTIPNTNGKWQYQEWTLPISGMTGNVTITAALNSPANIGLDDIITYPETAEVNTFYYDPVTKYALSYTNTNGISIYSAFDPWGRLLYSYDQDKNILQKNTFVTPDQVADFNNLSIDGASPVVNNPVALHVSGVDITNGVNTTWDFGDGSSTVTSALVTSPTHTYTTIGNKTVTATVVSPLFGTKSVTQTITVSNPANIQLSYNSYTFSAGDVSQVTFTRQGGGSYTFTGAQLNNATIPTGVYTISVYLSGGQLYNATTQAGYKSVRIAASCWNACASYVSNNSYSWSADLSTCTSLNLSIYQSDCPTAVE